jgi:type IV pilus assembly protein PilY1
MNTVNAIHKAGWFASVGALTLFSGSAAAAPLGLQDVPLFLSTGAEPNLMMMLDNSGSMQNIVPDVPYDPAVEYLANCPATNQVATTAAPQLRLSSGSPRLRVGGTDYVLGTGSGERCFVSTTNYLAQLNNDGSFGYLPSQYTGNYLNWYFSSTTDPTGCTNDWTSGRKPCTQSRIMIARTAGKNLVDSMSSSMRVGLSTYNNGDGGSLREIVGDLNTAKRTALKTKIDALNATGNTPLAETLSDIGRYFATGYTGNLTLHPGAANQSTATVANVFNNESFSNDSGQTIASPIQYSCQKSFAVLLTDGRPQGDRAISQYLRDYTGDCAAGQCDATPNGNNLPAGPLTGTGGQNGTKVGRSYENQGSDYLDDVAAGLFEMDVRPDLTDPLGAKNNVATYLISFADDQAINDPLMQATADRGGGEFFVAGNEAQLTAAFQAAFASIVQKTASASSASVNSGSISTDTRIYQAKFNSATWSGQLLAFKVNSDGSLGNGSGSDPTELEDVEAEWDASNELPAAGDRQIVTVNTDRTPVAFDWASIDATRQGQLDANATVAQSLLNYLRGDDTNEGTGTGKFRSRRDANGPNKLGDIVSSSPLFVGRPPFRYRDNFESEPYSEFATDNEDRDGMVYAGANDGMLHGFNAETGVEVFAFIPSPVFDRLKNLSSQTYTHQFYVDGPPSMGDVFYSNAWHTVLVGGLNKGGQGIYALDITDPDDLDDAEQNPSDVVLWEFTDRDDPSTTGSIDAAGNVTGIVEGDSDLGLTYSQPAIVKLRNGKWAAIFGNGYNNTNTSTTDTVAAGTVSTTGTAALYIVDIETGHLIKKFNTLTGTATTPNGLATPAAVDTNGDRVVEYVYAGDLYGNMWKFNLSSTNSADWSIAYGTTAAPEPLFRARDASNNPQPITVRPEVTRGPFGVGMMVLFGTGKYLELSDKNISPQLTQTFYGIADDNTNTSADQVSGRSALQVQQITHEIDPDGTGPIGNLRATTNNQLGTFSGWYMDLLTPPVPGTYQAEKQVSNPIVRNGNVIFTTLIPDTDPCGAGGSSWIMELSALSGSRLEATPFDINNDGQFTNGDYVTLPDGTRIPVSGVGSEEGILQSPGVIEGQMGTSGGGGVCVQYKYMPGSSGGIQKVSENCGPSGTGRQSWRQIR